jgi:hypothetical protein
MAFEYFGSRQKKRAAAARARTLADLLRQPAAQEENTPEVLHHFVVSEAAGDDGVTLAARKRVIETYDNCQEQAAFVGLGLNRRSQRRVNKIWSSAKWFHRDIQKIPSHPEKLPVYYFDNTDGKKEKEPAIKSTWFLQRDVTELEIIDDKDFKDDKGKAFPDMAFVTKVDQKLVAAKLSRRHRCHIKFLRWKKHGRVIEGILKLGRTGPRGVRKAGVYIKYILFGKRREGTDTVIDEYATKLDTMDKEDPNYEQMKKELEQVKAELKDLFYDMEGIGTSFAPDFDISVLNHLKQEEALHGIMMNGEEGKFAAIAFATQYWSPCHTDDDIWYTLLSCYSPSSVLEDKMSDEILFYFCFPSIGVAIPMRSTDILMFNSSFPHCATNYRKKDTVTFSLFTNSKVTNAHMTNQDRAEAALQDALADLDIPTFHTSDGI